MVVGWGTLKASQNKGHIYLERLRGRLGKVR